MWWWILGGILAAAAVVTIIGIITKDSIKDTMRDKDMDETIIELIDSCENTIQLKDLKSGEKVTLKGDGVDSTLRKGEVIKLSSW